MNRGSLWLLFLSLTAAGCTCGAFDPNTTRFACSSDDDCGAGYVCASANGGKECVLASTSGGGGGGSVTGGGSGGGGGGVLGGGGGATGGGDADGGDDAGTDGGLDGGDDAGLDAGVDGGTDGGARDGGTDGGSDGGLPTPDHLVITTPAQTLPTSTCSNPLTVQMRDSLDRPVTSPAITQLSLTSSLPQVSFFNGPGCAGANVGLTTIPAGSTSTTVSFRGLQPGTAVLSFASLTLRPGMVSQSQTLTAPPAALAFVTPAPVAPVAGFCFLATVEARSSGGIATNVSANTTINLQSVPADALRFFSDAACTTSVTSTVMPGGQSRASFYVKTISGGADTMVAIAPFGTASQQLQVTGVVRRGTCSLGSLQTSFSCPINPPQSSLSQTMLVYQATTGTNGPDRYEGRCRLTTVDTLTCERPGTGSQLFINWQTAELPTGMQVSRGAASSCPSPLPAQRTLPVSPVANPTSSFVLSSFSGNGTNYDGDDLSAMRLSPDAGFVFLDNRDFAGTGCTGYEYQVVQLDGVTTLRGSSGPLLQGDRQVTVSALPAASPNTVLLSQAVMSANPVASLSMCNVLVRGEMTTPTSLSFSRGADQINPLSCSNVTISDVAWERVDFGSRARVQAFTVLLSNTSTTVNIAAVDVTRALVFAGGQAAGGQTSGETAYDNTNDDNIGPAQVERFDFVNPTSVRLTRAASNSTASITFYVVELEP